VRLGQAEACELCEVQPRIVGSMCIPCDRLVRVEPRLKELNPDGKAFKNRTCVISQSYLAQIYVSACF